MTSTEQELQRTRALLAQARMDRDRLQEQTLRLAEQLRWLRRIPGTRTASQLRTRIPIRRPRRRITPVGTMASPRPGRYLDVTNLRNPARTGIARVTVRLGRESGYDLVIQQQGRLVHDATFVAEVHGRGPTTAELERAGKLLAPDPGVVVLDPGIQLDTWFDDWCSDVRRLRRDGVRRVQIVHDLLPVSLPDFFDYGMRRRFPQWLEFAVANSDLILTDSVATATDLANWVDAAASTAHPPITPWRLGADPLPPARVTKRDRPGPRVLAVGTVEPRKAIDVVVRAVSSLRERGVLAELVLVGGMGWAGESLLRELRSLTAAEWFTWHTDADDQQLADEYATADVLVAASRGEGFGLPIVEAQTAGVAVAARDLPVFRELLPAGASFFDADDDLADAIVSAWRHGPTSPVRDRPSWHEAAGTVDSLITGMIESHR